MKKVTLNLFAKLLIQPEINELNWLVSKIKGYKAKIKKILDLGSGYGEKTICLSNEFKDINFVGIDKYKSAITSSKKDSRHSTNPPNFMVGNINKLPFKDNSFDCIISIRSLHFIKNKAKKISEISRVLKKRGILLIISFFKKESFLIWLPRTIHERRFRYFLEKENFIKLAEKNNLKLIGSKKMEYYCGKTEGLIFKKI